jgi:hypothetical protein
METAAADTSGAELCHLSRWSIGPHFTASHSLSLTTTLLALLGSSDISLHNFYSLIEAFYNATLPSLQSTAPPCWSCSSSTAAAVYAATAAGVTDAVDPAPAVPSAGSFWRFVESDLPLLASYALHPHEDLRRAARLLVQGVLGRVEHIGDLVNMQCEWSALYDGAGPSSSAPAMLEEITYIPSGSHAPPLVSDLEFLAAMLLCYLQQAIQRKEQQALSHANAHGQHEVPKSSHAYMPSSRAGANVSPAPAATASSAPDSSSSSSPTAFIVSTLLRMLVQAHRDPSTHSLPKVAIGAELLVQGLSHVAHVPPPAHRAAATPSSPAAAKTGNAASSPTSALAGAPTLSRRGSFTGAMDGSEQSLNAFWSCVPSDAIEPLFRIIFELSLLAVLHPLTSNVRVGAGGGDILASVAAVDPTIRSASVASLNTTLLSFSSTCRVLLLELAKFDLLRFVEWAGRELAQSPPSSFFAALSSATTSASTAAASSSSVPPGVATDAASVWAAGCGSIKATQFDEYRIQLVSLLVSLPRKFAARMTYPVLHALTELLMRVLDPALVQQQPQLTRTPSVTYVPTAAGSPIAAPPAIPFSLRSRILALVAPSLPHLCARSSLLSLCVATHRLALVCNPRWLHATKLSRAPTSMQRNALEQEAGSVQLQAPSVVIFDIATGARVRALEGHAPGSDVLCVCFSPNGHRLASYSPRDGAQASLRVWALDDDDGAPGGAHGARGAGHGSSGSGGGGGFNPARLLMKVVFPRSVIGTQVLQLPQLPRASELCASPVAAAQCPAAVRFHDATRVVLVREDSTPVTMVL